MKTGSPESTLNSAEAQARINIDPARIYVVGHSNGGFMTYALACRMSPTIAAVLVISGAMPAIPCNCPATVTVSVLHIHGTADETIFFDGGALPSGSYPSANTSVTDWVRIDNCTKGLKAGATFEFAGKAAIPYAAGGCPRGVAVELWVLPGAPHVPDASVADVELATGWILGKSKARTRPAGPGAGHPWDRVWTRPNDGRAAGSCQHFRE